MPTRPLEDVLKEVRRIQIVARRQVNDLLAGEYLSAKLPGKLWFGNAASLLSSRFTTSPAVSRNSAKTNSPRSPKSER